MADKKLTVVKRKINASLLKKYESNIEERDEYLDMNLRGEKPRKIAEWAELIKYYSVEKPTVAFCVDKVDFERMMGAGKAQVQYVRNYLKRFGIPAIRVLVSSDKVKMWSRTPVK